MNAKRIKKRAGRLGVAAAVLATANVATADIIWSGFIDGDWQNGMNWTSMMVPGSGSGGVISMSMRFGPSPQFVLTNADDVLTDIQNIVFTGATGAYSIDGMGSFAIADGFSITNDSIFAQTINVDVIATGAALTFDASGADLFIGGDVDLTATATTLLAVTGGFNTTISGAITDLGGGISKTGGGTLTLSGDNMYTGNTLFAAGTIIAGDDGALGLGDLVVSGTATLESSADGRVIANDISISSLNFSISGSNGIELQGLISGSGGLTKKGPGDLLLSGIGGIHTYAGATTIQDGLVQVDLDALPDAGIVSLSSATATLELLANETIGSLSSGGTAIGTVELNGNTLTLTTGSSLYGGVLQGAGGSLVVTGTDLVLLSGANTFDGGTTFTADGAKVGLGSDMALGTGSLTLMNNASLTTALGPRTIMNDIVFSTPAASTVLIDGSDSLLLGGTIDLGAMEQTFDLTQTATVSGIISNGSLRKAGASTFTLSGMNTYTGDTNIDAGRLVLDGLIAGSAFVNSTGTLSGGGTVMGNLTAASGGSVDPGTGQGTLTVGGNYLQQTGSTLRVGLNAANSTSDLLDVTGTATLESGSTIIVSVTSPDFIMAGQEFRIIEADAGVFDAGATIDTSSATLRFELQRDSGFSNGDTDYRLEAIRESDAFSSPAEGNNNQSIGRAIDTLIPLANANSGGDAASFLGLLDTLDSTQYNQALLEMSPERHNVGTQLGIEGASDFTGLQSGYLSSRRGGGDGFAMQPMGGPRPGSLALNSADPFIIGQAIEEADNPFGWADLEPHTDDRFGAFARGFGVFSEQDTKGDRTGYESDAYGAAIGVDYRFSKSIIGGLAFAYTSNNADYNQTLGGIDVKALRIGPYMTWVKGDIFVDASLSFGSSQYDSTRSIPTLNLEAKGDYDGFDVTGYIGTGFDWRVDNAWSVRPTASLQYSYFDYDGFTETGAAGANMTVGGRESDSLRSRLGFAVQYLTSKGLFLQGQIGWQHEFLSNDTVESSFAIGGSPFTVATGDRDKTAFFFGGGVGIPISQSGFAYVRFENLTGDETEINSVTGGFGFRF